MKGAIADPSVNTKRAPNNARKMIIGANPHFLRTLRKSQNSKSIESFDIVNPYFFEFNGIIPSALSILLIDSATRRYPPQPCNGVLI